MIPYADAPADGATRNADEALAIWARDPWPTGAAAIRAKLDLKCCPDCYPHPLHERANCPCDAEDDDAEACGCPGGVR